jgi:hypothetical protein
VLVHSDDTRNHCFARQIKNLRIRRIGNGGVGGVNGDDLVTRNVDAHFLLRCCAGAVDESDVLQHQHRGVFLDVWVEGRGLLLRR